MATDSNLPAKQEGAVDTHDLESCWLASDHAQETVAWIRTIRGNLGWDTEVSDRMLDRAHQTAEYIRADPTAASKGDWPDAYVLALTIVSICLSDELPPPPWSPE